MAQDTPGGLNGKTALITGAARRIGAAMARRLHAAGMNLSLHYRSSAADAEALAEELLALRPGSVQLIRADLLREDSAGFIAGQIESHWGGLDLLINNASSFYPTPVGSIDPTAWDDLIGSNLKAPLFLSQACASSLRTRRGSIVNMIDIHGLRPRAGHAVYASAKAGLAMLTKVLALDLAPEIRVNGIAPGAILWPEGEAALEAQAQARLLGQIPLGREGHPDDLIKALLYLATSDFVTGEILVVDGGRSLN